MKFFEIITNHLTLSDQLTGVELSNDTLQNFVDDRGQHSFVVVCAEFAVDGGEVIGARSGEDSTSNVDHLQVWEVFISPAGSRSTRKRILETFCARETGNVAWLCTDVENYWGFEPWDLQTGRGSSVTYF